MTIDFSKIDPIMQISEPGMTPEQRREIVQIIKQHHIPPVLLPTYNTASYAITYQGEEVT